MIIRLDGTTWQKKNCLLRLKSDNAVRTANNSAQKVDLMDVKVQKHDTEINAMQTVLIDTVGKAEKAELVGNQARSMGENAIKKAEQASEKVVELEKTVVQYNAEKTSVSLNNATLNDLADGEVSETSSQAVTGKQLHATEQKVEKVVQEQLVPVQQQTAQIKSEVVTNKANIATNKANIAKNSQRMEQVVEVVNNQTARINENTRIVEAQAGQVTQNTQAVSKNRQAITENRQAIAENRQGIIENRQVIAENRQAIQSNSKRIDELENRSHQDRRQARAGVAGAMAMTQITPVQGKTFTVGAGVGTYRGEAAVSVGVKYAPKENVVISISGSADTRGGFGAATGVSFGLD